MKTPDTAEAMLPREFPGGRLRRLRASDLAVFQAYRAIPELGQFQGWSPMADSEALQFLSEMAQAPLFRPGEWLQLGITEAGSDRLIGDVGLYLAEDARTAEIGFTLQPAAQGRGLASGAVREALGLLFASTSVSRVLGISDARNLPSIRLLERLGFSFIETRQVEFRGEPCIEKVFALARNAV